MGFNLEAYRNLNKLKIFKPSNTESAEFTAYMQGGFSYSLNTETNSMFGSVPSIGGKKLQKIFGVTNLAVQELTDVTLGALDIQRKFLFGGTKPVSLQLRCFLAVKESYQKDIEDELDKLNKLFLPTRYKNITTAVTGTINDAKQKAKNEQAEKFDASGWKLLQEVVGVVSDWIGDIYLLKIPEDYNKGYRIKIGGITLNECIIKNVTVQFPPFVYMGDGVEDGLPDHVNLTIDVESIRNVAFDDGKDKINVFSI